MKSLYVFLGRIGSAIDGFSIVLMIVVLLFSWSLTLQSFGQHFKDVTGSPVLDLENVQSILTVEQALTLINGYSPAAKSLYWSFFIMDNLMPPLVFGSFALLWAKLFSSSSAALAKRLLNSPILLVPLGVGLFDWFENLAFITVLYSAPVASASPIMQLGLILVQLKALCLFATFGLTPVFILYTGGHWLWQRRQHTKQ
ncbi:MAG: hypothetical protein ACOYL5_17175 [Phototrophicaceae bacterium]